MGETGRLGWRLGRGNGAARARQGWALALVQGENQQKKRLVRRSSGDREAAGGAGGARTPCDDQKFVLSRMFSKSLPKPVDVDLGTFLAGTRPGPLRPGTMALAAAGAKSASDASMARRLVTWSEPMAMAGV